MLELTVTSGTELKIGDDIRIIFRGGNTPGRMQIGVEAPKEKQVERMKIPEGKKTGKVFIVRNENTSSERSDSKEKIFLQRSVSNGSRSSI